MDFKVLWRGDYISIISPKEYPYEAMHGKNGVMIVPIIDGKIGIRQELCPPYLVKDKTGERLYYTVISGQVDEEDINPEATMLRELKEEAGIIANDFKYLYAVEDIPELKGSTHHIGLYILDIKRYQKTEIKGDGTMYEAKSKTIWVSPSRLAYIVTHKKNIDFPLVSAYFMLKEISNDNFLWTW